MTIKQQGNRGERIENIERELRDIRNILEVLIKITLNKTKPSQNLHEIVLNIKKGKYSAAAECLLKLWCNDEPINPTIFIPLPEKPEEA